MPHNLADKGQAWELMPDGSYRLNTPGKKKQHIAQAALLSELVERA
ncbi:hypothetical protein J2T60_002485 [Natronospira proteinivora]|uniref:Transposase n=1 Tax=Natronospira proteinivora TaxID=1807133 RepID=A0ABT1GC30_9GAMM|nr:hypothetical protein [Natronospira proteinivora]MCP1728485.1 hypothetical protein [Natronospira proteinivora]